MDTFEHLLAECLERYATDGKDAVERLLADKPEHSVRVRARFEELARLGMLGTEREARPPRTFGPYDLLERLGQGGMGSVWLARDARDGRTVALKVADVAFDENGRARARFEREVRAFGQLSHPNIVPILDAGEAHGRPYFTMEHVEGATLARVIEELARRRVPPEQLTGEDVRQVVLGEAALDADTPVHAAQVWRRSYVETVCRIVLDVCDALSHAHAHGIVHRDVKPSNVILRRDGRALLVDLGLAHVADQPALTRSGDLAGTPYYLSPEQAGGAHHTIDARTDVWALGVTLFELLTLERPFGGRTTPEVLDAIRRREPPFPSRWNSAVPHGLETICLTALEKHRARRYADVEALAADLHRLLAFEPVRARPIGRLRRASRFVLRNPTPSLALTLGLVMLVGLPAGLLWANARIRVQRDRSRDAALEASREARLKSRVTDFLVELYAFTDEPGQAEPSAREFLERGAQRIETDFRDQPLVHAALMEALGRAYANLGLAGEALPLLDRAFSLLQRELGETHPDVAAALRALAEVHLAQGDDETALALARRSLAAFDGAGAAGSARAVAARITLAEAAARLGSVELAEHELERALEERVALEGESVPGVATVLERLGELALERGALDVAAARLEHALAIREAALAPDPSALARLLGRLAELHLARGDEPAATRRAASARELEARAASGRLAGRGLGADGAEVPRPAALLLTLADLRPAWHTAYRASFQAGITALQAARYAEAIAAFERCLAWKPDDPVCAYNIACAWSLSRDRERAFAWFERAVDGGFGDAEERVETSNKDADVALLRKDPRWPGLVERMRARAGTARQAALELNLREPDRRARKDADPDVQHALLVVLHAEGGTPADVLGGAWAELADELGFLLLAPAGGLPGVGTEGEGLRWYEDVDDLVDRPLGSEERVLMQVREACERYAVDPRRVVLCGERSAAPLAFDIAVRAPGLFSGILLVDGPPLPEVAEQRTRTAALLGLRVELAFTRGSTPWPGTLPAQELAQRSVHWLASRGLASTDAEPARQGASDPAEAAPRAALERLLERDTARAR